jgi:hypothetical protein
MENGKATQRGMKAVAVSLLTKRPADLEDKNGMTNTVFLMPIFMHSVQEGHKIGSRIRPSVFPLIQSTKARHAVRYDLLFSVQ